MHFTPIFITTLEQGEGKSTFAGQFSSNRFISVRDMVEDAQIRLKILKNEENPPEI